jgi:hypothetical protein
MILDDVEAHLRATIQQAQQILDMVVAAKAPDRTAAVLDRAESVLTELAKLLPTGSTP